MRHIVHQRTAYLRQGGWSFGTPLNHHISIKQFLGPLGKIALCLTLGRAPIEAPESGQ
jgi:hypothetical protein